MIGSYKNLPERQKAYMDLICTLYTYDETYIYSDNLDRPMHVVRPIVTDGFTRLFEYARKNPNSWVAQGAINWVCNTFLKWERGDRNE